MLDRRGRSIAEEDEGSFAQAAQAVASARRVWVLAPAADVLVTDVPALSRSRGRMRQAAPYAVEEVLADDIDNLHVALAERPGNDVWPVAVIRRALLDQWLRQLDEAGLQADALVPESWLLPDGESQQWFILERTTDIVVRAGGPVYLFDSAGFEIGVRQLCSALGVPDSARMVVTSEGGTPDVLPFPADREHCSLLQVVSERSDQTPLNLLQGGYLSKRSAGGPLRSWRVAAISAFFLVVLMVTQSGIHNMRLERANAALKEQIWQTFRSALPEVKRIQDPRAQMEVELNALLLANGQSSAAGFVRLLALSAPVLAQQRQVTLESMSYREGRLQLDLKAVDVASLDKLEQELGAQQGLKAALLSAVTGESGVEGRIQVSG